VPAQGLAGGLWVGEGWGGVQEGGEVSGKDISKLRGFPMQGASGGVPKDSGSRGLIMVLEDEPMSMLGSSS